MGQKLLTGYLAPEGFTKDLEAEILRHHDLKIIKHFERLFLVEGPFQKLCWSQNEWLQPQRADIKSIGDAVKILKAQGKLWAPYFFKLHRRGSLIQDQLPKIKNIEQKFLAPLPSRELGAWALEDETTLWFSPTTTSPFPCGELEFQENKEAPSRAYLKLWEFFTRTGHRPQKGEKCLDLGSSPGGWTWVLAELGAEVISVDKAPLDPKLRGRAEIHSLKKDAFALKPADIGPVDWLFSDLICYPERLLALVKEWRQSGLVKNMCCTIKFQGETDFETLQKFSELPDSRILHLCCNKHELTWFQPLTKEV
jgi:23S rRNA (cytidine2498-2'-O)-methyltransferase